MKIGLSRFYNFKYKYTLGDIWDHNIISGRNSLSGLFGISTIWYTLSNITKRMRYMGKMNLKYIVSNNNPLNSKDVLCDHITINMSTDGKLSAYSRDEW